MKISHALAAVFLAGTLVLLSVNVAVSEQYRFVTAESGLNLRTAPSSGSDVIKLLEHGSSVLIVEEQGDWSRIVVFADEAKSQFITGWAASQYLGDSAPAAPRSPTVVPTDELSIDLLGFECETGLLGAGYESCDLEISATLNGPSWVNATVPIECAATIETRAPDDIFPLEEYGNSYDQLYVSSGYGHAIIYMDVPVSRILGEVYSAKLRDLECFIN